MCWSVCQTLYRSDKIIAIKFVEVKVYMAEYTFSLEEVAERIERLPVLFDEEPGIVHVTQNGKPVMEIMSPGLLKALHAA